MVNKPVCFSFPPLQSLSMLLNGTPFAFVIDLAALASRREYLKLDKWLTDKIREHGVIHQFDFVQLFSETNEDGWFYVCHCILSIPPKEQYV